MREEDDETLQFVPQEFEVKITKPEPDAPLGILLGSLKGKAGVVTAVTKVAPGGLGEKAGLLVNDVVLFVSGLPITDEKDAIRLAREAPSEVVLRIRRLPDSWPQMYPFLTAGTPSRSPVSSNWSPTTAPRPRLLRPSTRSAS